MIFVPPKFIFIVGGSGTKTVELFDIEKNTIEIGANKQIIYKWIIKNH